MSTDVTFNGRTPADLGFEWVASSGLYGGPDMRRSSITRGNRMGSFLPDPATVPASRIDFEFRLQTAMSTHQAALDDLREWLQGAIEIELPSDNAGRRLYGTLARDRGTIWTSAGAYTEASAIRAISLSFDIASPVWFDQYVRPYALAANTATEISDLGSRASWFEVHVPGATTDFLIESLLPNGARLDFVDTTGSVGASEYLRIPMAQERVYLGSGGSETDETDTWLSGSWGAFFPLDPRRGVPFLKASANCVVHIRRAY